MTLQYPNAPSHPTETVVANVRPINGTMKAGTTKQITLNQSIDKPYQWKVKSGSGSITESGLLKANPDAVLGSTIEVIVVGEGIESTVSTITIVE